MAKPFWRRGKAEARDGLGNPNLPVFDYILGLTDGDMNGGLGSHVTAKRAMRVTAFLACVKLLAETIASLPVQVFEQGDVPGTRQASADPRADLLSIAPNPDMTAFTFWQFIVVSMATWGNAFVFMEADEANGLTALWPIPPTNVEIRKRADGSTVYLVGSVGDEGGKVALLAAEVMHFKGVGLTADVGMSNIDQAREALGLSIAAEEYAGRMFTNDGRPGVLFEQTKTMTDEQFSSFRNRWQSSHEGVRNAHKFGLLPPGLSMVDTNFDPTNLQMIEARKFQVREMARLMRVPPHMIADLDGSATFASVEQMSIDFLTYTIRPWIVNIAQTVRRGMFMSSQDRAVGRFIDHDTSVLLRTDSISQAKIDSVDRLTGIRTANEIREKRGLSPMPGGDVLWQPVNVAVIGPDGEVISAIPNTPTAPAPDDSASEGDAG